MLFKIKFFFTFRISQVHLFLFLFSVFILISKLLPYLSSSCRCHFFSISIFCLSSHAHIRTTLHILRHSCSNHFYIFIIKQLKIIDMSTFKLGSVQSELWLTPWHLRRILASLLDFRTNLILWESLHWRKKIIKKCSIKKFVYLNHIYDKPQTLRPLGIWKKWPSAYFKLVCHVKITIVKNIIITPITIDSYCTTRLCWNLCQAYLLEVDLTQILAKHAPLSTTSHVGRHVDFSTTNYSLGL